MDRLVAAAAGMSAALYFLAGGVAWLRWAFPRSTQDSLVKKVVFDRAVAWSGLCVLFTLVSLVKLNMAEWTDNGVDILLLVALSAVYVSGLVSIRAITLPRYGYRALALFAGISLAVGLLILLL